MTKSTPLSELPRMGNVDVAHARQNQVPSLPLPVNTSLGNDINEDNDETIMEALRQLPGGDSSMSPPTANPMMGMAPQAQIPSTQTLSNPMPPNMSMERVDNKQSIEQAEVEMQLRARKREQERLQAKAEEEAEEAQARAEAIAEEEQARMRSLPKSQAKKPQVQNKGDAEHFEDFDENDNESHYEEEINNSKKNILKRGFSDVFHQNSEIKRIVIIMVVFIVITYLPVELLMAKYIAFDKFPYACVVIKAIFAGILYFTIMNLL